jgi:hypothetical protein
MIVTRRVLATVVISEEELLRRLGIEEGYLLEPDNPFSTNEEATVVTVNLYKEEEE